MKYIKRAFIGALILILLIGIAVFILLTFYKKEMARLLTDSLKDNYGLTLKVGRVNVSFFDNWPQASVQLSDIYLANTSDGKSKPLLKAGKLSLSFDLEKLVKKQFIVQSVSLDNAEVNMLRYADGSKNFEFKQQQKTTTGTGLSFEISRILIHNTHFNFYNLERRQHIGIQFIDEVLRLKHYDDGIDIKLNGLLVVDELLFKEEKGPFLKHTRAKVDLDMDYFKKDKVLCIHAPSRIEIENQQYQVASLLQLGEDKRLALHLASNNIWYEKVARLLTPKIKKTLATFEIKKPLNAQVLIMTHLGRREEPVLIVDVSARNSDLTIGNNKIPYSKVNFTGRIISIDASKQHGNGETARIIFKPVSGFLYNFPFTATVTVSDLTDPSININGSLHIEASKINSALNKEFALKGSCTVKLDYSGPTKRLNKTDFLSSYMKLNAILFFNNLTYAELSRPYKYTVKGKATMNNRDLRFDKLLLKTDGGEALITGNADGFVNYVLGYSNSLKAKLSAKTESLDLNPYLAGTTTTEVVPKADSVSVKQALQQTESHFEFTISLAAKKLFVKNVAASNALIDVFYRTNYLNVRSASMNACDGRIMAKGTMENFNKINSEMMIQDVNVNELFVEFDNFGQKTIVSDNLKGRLSVDARFKTLLSDNMHIVPESMTGDVRLTLREGHLINFEPVQNMSNFLFRHRNFDDVSFSELNESFTIRGTELKIDELEVGSSLLNIYVVNGLYNFKGNSNMNLLIPWSNLRHRGKDYVPKNSGQSAENTRGLKLNYSGPPDHMKISLGHKELKKQ